MFNPADGSSVPVETVVIMDNLERIANNGVFFQSEGDRKGRDQIAGVDHLMTTVYIDGEPTIVDMRVRIVERGKAGGSDNVLYYFTPETITVATKKGNGAASAAERHALRGEASPFLYVTVPQSNVKVNESRLEQDPFLQGFNEGESEEAGFDTAVEGWEDDPFLQGFYEEDEGISGARTSTGDREFRKALEIVESGGRIEVNDVFETEIATKPFSEVQPFCGKLPNRTVRKWYLFQDARIPELIDRGRSLEEQARQACELRNQSRTNARELMYDQDKRRELDATDPNRSFEELISDKMRRKGLSREEAVRDILRTATKTRKSVNKQLGLE